MREIKFRGFNRKNSEWIYGFYLQNRGAHFVCPDEFANGKSWDDYEIEPDTLGQFTGLRDKNGKEIYEGDVVRRKDSAYGMEDIGVVKFDCSLGAFVLESENRGRTYRALFKKGFSDNDGKCTIEGKYSYE